jgi:hypothetical protein
MLPQKDLTRVFYSEDVSCMELSQNKQNRYKKVGENCDKSQAFVSLCVAVTN